MPLFLLLLAAVAAPLVLSGEATAGCVAQNGVVEPPEECDPGGGTFCDGDPAGGACVTGADCDPGINCYFAHSCCKFNCQYVGEGAGCDDGNGCTDGDRCEQNVCAGDPTAPGTGCDDGVFCNGADECSGATCSLHAGNPCTGECRQTCIEATALCADAPGTPCTDDGRACSDDLCNGSGTCTHPARPMGTVCHASAGVCDVGESCDGSSLDCPVDLFVSSSTACRPSADVCDVAENCTGGGPLCPADAFASPSSVCRPSAGGCDVAENCTGDGPLCPADAFASPSSVCRPSAGACDVDETCTGSGVSCPADGFLASSTVCRAAAGVCDVAENCTGSGPDCPVNAFAPSSTVCRAAAGACDVGESCTGGGAGCPADGFASSAAVCRPAAGTCDVVENCTGGDVSCPANVFVASGEACDDGNGCSAGSTCDGASAGCPAGTPVPDGTSCDDENRCTLTSDCVGGVCTGGPTFFVEKRATIGQDGVVSGDLFVADAPGTAARLEPFARMADDTRLSARTVRLGAFASAFDVFADRVSGRQGVIRGTRTAAPLPSPPDVCPAQVVSCGTTDVVVGLAQTAQLLPGVYGDVSIGDGGRLELEEGTYEFCSLYTLSDVSITVNPGAGSPMIKIKRFLRTGDRVAIEPAAGALPPTIYVGGSVVLRESARVSAQLIVPGSNLRFGELDVFDGTACARRLRAFRGAQLGCR